MGNYNPNGGRNTPPDDNRPSWRPQDQSTSSARVRGNDDDNDHGSWRDRNQDRETGDRDPSRWEGSRGSELGHAEDRGQSTERYGQGQSGYSAGRYGEDRSQRMQNRNDMMRGASSREDRDLGTDDRFTGRSGQGAWAPGNAERHERHGMQASQERGSESDRGSQWRAYDRPQGGRNEPRGMGGYDQRMGYDSGPQGYERMGYPSGPGYSGSEGYGGSGWQGSPGGHGWQGSPGGQGAQGGRPQGYGGTQDDPQRMGTAGQRQARGAGPHRGKGPSGYQRSDERIRELVCEALAEDEHIDASQIQVAVKDGEVTLTGTVDERRVRRDAEDCVAHISGVRDVHVQLRVRDDKAGPGVKSQTSQSAGQSSADQPDKAMSATSPSTSASQAGKDSESASDKKHRA